MNFIISLLCLEVMGILLVRSFFRLAKLEYSITELFSLAFFIGAASGALILFYYDRLGLRYTAGNVAVLPAMSAVILAAGVVLKAVRAKWMPPSPAATRPLELIEKILLAGIAVQFLWVLFLAVPMPVSSHDGLANYALKAKIFYLEGGIPEGFYKLGEAAVSHPDYPPLLSLVMTWVYIFTGFNDLIVSMIMPVFYAAFLALVYALLRRMFSRKYSLLMTFLLATIPQVGDYAALIHSDLILAAVVSCAFGYFALYLRSLDRRFIILSSVLLGISFWVKNEAMVFAFTMALTFSLFMSKEEPRRRTKALADMLIALAVIAVIAFPWLSLRASENLVNSDLDVSRLTGKRLLENAGYIPVVLDMFQQEIFGPKKWNIFWIGLVAAMVWKRKALMTGERRYMGIFLALSLAGYFAAYMMMTGEYNLYFYANTTISRFMLHFTGIGLFLLAFLVGEDVEEAL